MKARTHTGTNARTHGRTNERTHARRTHKRRHGKSISDHSNQSSIYSTSLLFITSFSWLDSRSSVRVRVLPGVTVFHSLHRCINTVVLVTMFRRNLAEFWRTTSPSRGNNITPGRFMLQKQELITESGG